MPFPMRRAIAMRDEQKVQVVAKHDGGAADNHGVLSFEIHRELTELISAVNCVVIAAEQRAPIAEIELGVTLAREKAAHLEAMVDAEFGSLRRHLAWLLRRHREGRPELADGDIVICATTTSLMRSPPS
jgi:hypothetical protein